jgi:hypothetical protein
VQQKGMAMKDLSAFARTASAALAVGSVMAVAAPSAGNANTFSFGTYDLTLSNAFGTGSFGTVTVSDLTGGVADIAVNVAPNYVVDTGGHFPLTFSLAGGTVVTTSFSNTHYSLDTASGPFSNDPFSSFTSAIQSDCTDGASSTCQTENGHGFDFKVTGFTGLNTATNLFNNVAILFAVDIFNTSCTITSNNGCTGVVGASAQVTGGGHQGQTPLPAALPLMGSLLGAGYLVSMWRRRRSGSDSSTFAAT